MTNKLFIYGTLQDPNIQLEILGRNCPGTYGLVDNHILIRDWVVDGKAYPRIFPHSIGCVIGQVIEVSDEELEILDEYETDAYERVVIHVKDQGLVQTYFYNKKRSK